MAAPVVYRNHGILFEPPAEWELEEQTNPDGDVTITLNDGAAFWSLTLLFDRPEIERVLNEARDALYETYDEIDAESVKCKISRRDAIGFDLQFVCMELINTAHLRCFRTGRFTGLLFYQLTDHERRYYEPLFQQLTDSLDVDQDGEILIG